MAQAERERAEKLAKGRRHMLISDERGRDSAGGRLEQVCFSEPWTEQGLRESFARPEYLFVTATEDGQVVGYAGLYQVLDEGDITNIAVLPSAREKE